MCAMVLSTSVPSSTDGDWVIVFFAFGAVTSALMHWRLKSGWQMTTGRMKPSPAFYPTYVCLLFSALPMMIGSIGLIAIGVLLHFELVSKSWVWADRMLIAMIVALGGVGWGVKEFYSPTRSRTPAWLAGLDY
jgi:hypothetical protein